MPNLARVVRLLKKEQDRLAKELRGIGAALAAFAKAYVKGTGSRKLSASARARIAASQRARRAKFRATAKVVPMGGKADAIGSCAKKDRCGTKSAMGKGEGRKENGLIFFSSILDPKAAQRDLLKARNMEMVSSVGFESVRPRNYNNFRRSRRHVIPCFRCKATRTARKTARDGMTSFSLGITPNLGTAERCVKGLGKVLQEPERLQVLFGVVVIAPARLTFWRMMPLETEK